MKPVCLTPRVLPGSIRATEHEKKWNGVSFDRDEEKVSWLKEFSIAK